jgi:hypothetical protein
MARTRSVGPPAAAEAEVLAEIAALSTTCVDGVEFLLEELERQDPDPDERCGLLAARHEVYALRPPGCAARRLVVSIDRRARAPGACVVHGVVSSTARPCDAGRRRAEAQLDLVNPVWEPA